MSLYFSIVMPAYNEEECIEDVVQMWTSFLTETFPNKPTKLIVINDGSKDDSAQILAEIAKIYPDHFRHVNRE